jgi:parvulin-like peptidyl-prolyl isomerase
LTTALAYPLDLGNNEMNAFHRAGATRKPLPIIFAGLMLAVATLTEHGIAAEPRPEVAAIVDGRTIPVSRVRELALRSAGPAVLDQLIGNALIDQEARKRHIVVTSSEVENRIDHIRKLAKPNGLDASLRERHMSLGEMREQIRIQIEVEKLMTPSLPPVKLAARERQFQIEAPKYVDSLRRKGRVIVYIDKPMAGRSAVAAVVNGYAIPRAKVEDLAYRMAGESIVRHMTDVILVDEEAKRQKIVVPRAEVDAKVAKLRRSMGPRSFESMLHNRHLSMDEFRDQVRTELASYHLIWKSLGPLKLTHVRDIFILTNAGAAWNYPGAKPHSDSEARTLMAHIQAELRAGKKFADLAREYSDDTDSKASGGDVGLMQPQTRFGSTVYEAASTLKRGEITPQPVTSADGLHLIMAISTEANHPASENALYARTVDSVHMRELQFFLRPYLEHLRGTSKIVDNLADKDTTRGSPPANHV